ncbi:hypothetical protein ACOSQ3_028084 [Xanthoceras sorbifolium]
MGRSVRWPDKMMSPLDQRDNSKWCEFHSDHGHRIEHCVALRLEVAELLKKGHLKEFLTDKGKQTFLNKDRSRDIVSILPPEPPKHERTVNVISSRLEVNGVTYSEAKRHSRQAVPLTYHQVIRFPTRWGVHELRGQQKTSRDCFQNTLKSRPSYL